MKAPSFIQENNQERICKHCEKFILGQSRNTIHFQCEGRYCDDANESYYEDYPEESERMPEFIYRPSEEVNRLEEKINQRIEMLEHQNVLSGLMLLRSGFFWATYELPEMIPKLQEHLYNQIVKQINIMMMLRCEIMKEGGSVSEMFTYPEMKANFKINNEWKRIQETKWIV